MKKKEFDLFVVTRYIPASPFKLRKVIDSIRGKNALEALQVLSNLPQRPARYAYKALFTALADAKNNHKLDSAALDIAGITVDAAKYFKRFQARARGRAYEVTRRLSHLSIGLSVNKGEKIGTKN